jgi:hypothetical protein
MNKKCMQTVGQNWDTLIFFLIYSEDGINIIVSIGGVYRIYSREGVSSCCSDFVFFVYSIKRRSSKGI